MKIIFWQNIISPHQTDFLKALIQKYPIILIVDEVIDAERRADGWSVPDFSDLKIVIAPQRDSLDQFFQEPGDLHVFSGISAYPTVFAGFKKAIKCRAKIGILSEPINLSGLKGFLKLLRGHLQRIKYGNKIGFIAATGDLGVDTYKRFGYAASKIFQWGYFVNSSVQKLPAKKNNFLFVGNLNNNKQILPLLKIFIDNDFNIEQFLILGSGVHSEQIKKIIVKNQKIRFCGRLSNEDTVKILSESKLLILPSLEDGWGVVVNEALLSGTPVITSDQVGAKILIENSDRGEVFKVQDYIELKNIIKKWSLKNYEEKDYLNIKSWAEQHITPTKAADYFSEIISFIFDDKGRNKPIAPWLKKNHE